MLSQLINTPCVITRRLQSEDTDDAGNEQPAEQVIEAVCELQQQRREEPGGQGELSDTHWAGFFLPGIELRTGDAVFVEGLGEFELVGDPWPARNPRTRQLSHLEATLRRAAGSEDEGS